MIHFSARRIVLALLGLVIATFAILTPCFTIMRLDSEMIVEIMTALEGALGDSGSGMGELMGAAASLYQENGFDLLGGNSMFVKMLNMLSKDQALAAAGASKEVPYVVYDWMSILLQIFNIVILVAGVAFVALIIVWFCLWNKDGAVKAVAFSGLGVGVLYMAGGLTFFFVFKNAMSGFLEQEGAILPGMYKTACFVPLILIVVAETAFWVCFGAIKERDPEQIAQRRAAAAAESYEPQAPAYREQNVYMAAPAQAAPHVAAASRVAAAPQSAPALDINEKAFTQNLARLKEMCDSGVITQEEYEEQKTLNLYGGAAAALAKQWQLYQSGLITEEEYDELKKKILKLE